MSTSSSNPPSAGADPITVRDILPSDRQVWLKPMWRWRHADGNLYPCTAFGRRSVADAVARKAKQGDLLVAVRILDPRKADGRPGRIDGVQASRALLAAQRQGKYAALHDAVLKLREEPTEAVLKREAEHLGLDWAKLKRDMEDPAVQRRIEANLGLAQALGVQGTPAMVVGGALVPGAVELAALERLVAEARGAAAR